MADFQEAEVWAVMKPTESQNPKSRKNLFPGSSSSSAWRRFTAASRAIPRASGGGGATRQAQQYSAPVSIPDWSKVLRKQPRKNLWDDACDAHDDAGNAHHVNVEDYYNHDDEDDGEMVPPHEYLARRLARTQIASFSMCEGVGRTLKGRDLSNLRNAILTKTGFLE